MIVKRTTEEITAWFIAFHRHAATRWVRWLIPGRYKHVSAFGYSDAARTWVFLDVSLACTRVILLPNGVEAEATLGRWTASADILHLAATPQAGTTWRIGFWCVPAVKHLLGLRGGALLPDQLWRSCLAQGAKIVSQSPHVLPEPRPTGPATA